jgi:hypothetical protein
MNGNTPALPPDPNRRGRVTPDQIAAWVAMYSRVVVRIIVWVVVVAAAAAGGYVALQAIWQAVQLVLTALGV